MKRAILLAGLVAMPLQPALAAKLVVQPVQVGAETVHFIKGVPTLNIETPQGAVEITPLPFDHGHIAFGISVYNKSMTAANFGIENVAAVAQDQNVPVLSAAELAKRAKSRATWSQIGVALLAGATAAAVANAHTTDTYHGRMRTPHGVYSWTSTYRDNSIGTLGATAAVAGGAAGIIGIKNRLDYTLANIADEVVQTTTVDGDSSYGGQVVLEKFKAAQLPYDVNVTVSFNGAQYPFTWRVAKEGTPAPAFTAITPTPPPPPEQRDAAPVSAPIPGPLPSGGGGVLTDNTHIII